jgi:ribosomal protein S18 acetylase RimI-like enzyme
MPYHAPQETLPVFLWRGDFESAEVEVLHAECFGHAVSQTDWLKQVTDFSVGRVCARWAGQLIGFVNVAWDGGLHAFLLDSAVSRTFQRRGIGRKMICEAVLRTRQAGCEWLHVDFANHLQSLYFEACGFQATHAG